jgi:hypothetical protein
MEKLTIEIRNEKAFKFLQSMEDLNLIRVLRKQYTLSSLRKKINVKMNETEIDSQLSAIRKEWKRDI